ncbi:MAG: Fic family protein [Chthonomonadales bacterium]
MPNPNELLARSLERIQTEQNRGVVRAEALGRTHTSRLLKAGFIKPIINGWYYLSDPADQQGRTTWFTVYWSFLRQYLPERFGAQYCLSARQSLLLHTGSTVVPEQLIVITKQAVSQKIDLIEGVSLLMYHEKSGFPEQFAELNGVQCMNLADALVRIPESFFQTNPNDAAIGLQLIQDAGELIGILLEGGRSHIAGRLAGAFRHVGMYAVTERILTTMRDVGYDVRESNPFERPVIVFGDIRPRSPYAARLRSLWGVYREQVAATAPAKCGPVQDFDHVIAQIENAYQRDAYHSLSIEGYHVTDDLIFRVRQGDCNPAASNYDKNQEDALAARGYYEAFTSVRESIEHILTGAEPADLLRKEHHAWHRALSGPAMRAGIVSAVGLSGYRNQPVYIRGSRHVPFPSTAVPDAMEALFSLLKEERDVWVRAVLGHFCFVYIHPYHDGNGRLGRFLMNVLLVAGGYPWTVIELQTRTRYMSGLESASAGGDALPIAEFISECVAETIRSLDLTNQ